jgi:hypothetical protein
VFFWIVANEVQFCSSCKGDVFVVVGTTMPKLEANKAKVSKVDPATAPFFNNMLGSCGELQPISQRPFTDAEAKNLGVELPALDRCSHNLAPATVLPRLFYEKLVHKFMKMPGQKGEHPTIASN